MTITREQAVAYFNEKAPKGLREKGIKSIDEYVLTRRDTKERFNVIVINECYFVRYIVPQAMNCLMKRQNFKPIIKGVKLTQADAAATINYWQSVADQIK